MSSYTYKYIKDLPTTYRDGDHEYSIYNGEFCYFNWTSRKIWPGIKLTQEELDFFNRYGLGCLIVWRGMSCSEREELNSCLKLYQAFWELYYEYYEDVCLYAIMHRNTSRISYSPYISDVMSVRYYLSNKHDIIGFKKRLETIDALRAKVAHLYHMYSIKFTTVLSKYLNHYDGMLYSSRCNCMYEIKPHVDIIDSFHGIAPDSVGIWNLTENDCVEILKHSDELLEECNRDIRVKTPHAPDKTKIDDSLSHCERVVVMTWCRSIKKKHEIEREEERKRAELQMQIEAEQKRKEEETRRGLYRFNIRNKHHRDTYITFDERFHKYTVDGVVLQSVTNFVEGCFPKFDAELIAKRVAMKRGISPQEVLKLWEQNRVLGTTLHKKIENYYKGMQSDDDDAYRLFKVFANKVKLQPYRTEWAVYDMQHKIAGTIDFVDCQNGEYIIYDWKRSDKIIENGMPVKVNKYGEKGKFPLSHLDDTPYYHYAMQLSIYKYILEKNYGKRISDLRLGVFHPSYDKPYILRMPYLEKEVNDLFNLRSEVIF